MTTANALAMEGARDRTWREYLDDCEWLRREVGSRGVRAIAASIGCGWMVAETVRPKLSGGYST